MSKKKLFCYTTLTLPWHWKGFIVKSAQKGKRYKYRELLSSNWLRLKDFPLEMLACFLRSQLEVILPDGLDFSGIVVYLYRSLKYTCSIPLYSGDTNTVGIWIANIQITETFEYRTISSSLFKWFVIQTTIRIPNYY